MLMIILLILIRLEKKRGIASKKYDVVAILRIKTYRCSIELNGYTCTRTSSMNALNADVHRVHGKEKEKRCSGSVSHTHQLNLSQG